MSASEFDRLLNATDEEWDEYIGCPHNGDTYTEPGPLTGETYTRCADCHSVVNPVVGVESAEEADMCRPVEVDGQIVRVRGEREMNDTARAALAEVVAAAKRELAAESNQETK